MFDMNESVRIAPNPRGIPQNQAEEKDFSSPRLKKKYEEQLASGEFMSAEEFVQRLEWLKKYLREKNQRQNGVSSHRKEQSVG